MKKTFTIFIILLIGFFAACEKTATKPSDNYLSGKWTERVPDGMMYYAGTLHSFSFDKDSFRAKIISWTDVIVVIIGVTDSCPSNGYDETFIRGTYFIANDSIYFSGKLCDSLYQNFQPTCFGVADYNTKFRFTQNDTAIILNEDQGSTFGYGIILKKE